VSDQDFTPFFACYMGIKKEGKQLIYAKDIMNIKYKKE
jgi:hypothetical protein